VEKGKNGQPVVGLYVTSAEATAMAEEQAGKILGVSLEEALTMLDRGELAGTAAEAEFSMFKFLADKRDTEPSKA
jgi:hypothetical protein